MIKKEILLNILKRYEEKGEFSGAILVSENGKEIFSYACGYENISYNIKNNVDTIFPTASATKIFTAVSIFQLIECGKLKLDSKVMEILQLKNTTISEKITVKNLLNHTSGISDYFDEYDENCIENIWARVPNSSIKETKDFLPYFTKKQPLFNQGEKFDYCNSNYILLGLIIEKITNMKYSEYVRENIFLRYGLLNTDFISLDSTEKIAEGYLPVYDESNEIIRWKKNIYLVPSNGSPDGGAYTTVKDLNKFLTMLRNGEILSTSILEVILEPEFLNNTENEKDKELWKYNFGMWFNTKNKDIICYGVTGGDPGVSVKAFYYKESDITVIILGNIDNCSNELNSEIRDLII